MGSTGSNISPERDLLDLHGRVAIVTGAKCVSTITRDWRAIVLCSFFFLRGTTADETSAFWQIKVRVSACTLRSTS